MNRTFYSIMLALVVIIAIDVNLIAFADAPGRISGLLIIGGLALLGVTSIRKEQ